MPVITVEAGILTKEQKEALARELTKSASDIMKLPPEVFITLLKENPYDNVAMGGKLVSEKHKG